jgi:porphobilinogen synthase
MQISIKLSELIYPYFVVPGKGKKQKIKSFPDIYRFSIDRLIKDIVGLKKLGLNKILLFGVSDKKDAEGSSAYKEGNIVSLAVTAIKARFPDIVVFTDVCLCAYTTHGHCGILQSQKSKVKSKKYGLDNVATLRALSKIALAHAQAGADYVAPSAMAKGQVRAIRDALDINGLRGTKIMGYSAKFCSNFYGPFRNAADSAAKFGDRSEYQLGFKNSRKAFQEIKEDIKEGADMVMVKPALSYLDIIKEASFKVSHPIVAYNVSGEYAFVKYGVKAGLWDEKKIVAEITTSIKRAGADFIISYHAKDIAKWQKSK